MSGAWRRERHDEDDDVVGLRAELDAMRRERAEHIALCRSARAAQEKAARADLKHVELRVFTAVLAFTESWSRWSDEVYLSQLGTQAGIGGTAKSRATAAGRAARRLAELGIIEYEPGRGQGMPGRIGVPRVVLSAVLGDNSSLLKPPAEPQLKETDSAFKETDPALKESHCDSPILRDPEVLSVIPKRGRDAEAVDNSPTDDGLRSGLFEHLQTQAPPPPPPPPADVAHELLAAVAQAAPNSARYELLHDPEQAAGRAALLRRLPAIAALVGHDAAVTALTGEWGAAVETPMAWVLARAKAVGGGAPTGTIRAPPPCPAAPDNRPAHADYAPSPAEAPSPNPDDRRRWLEAIRASHQSPDPGANQ